MEWVSDVLLQDHLYKYAIEKVHFQTVPTQLYKPLADTNLSARPSVVRELGATRPSVNAEAIDYLHATLLGIKRIRYLDTEGDEDANPPTDDVFTNVYIPANIFDWFERIPRYIYHFFVQSFHSVTESDAEPLYLRPAEDTETRADGTVVFTRPTDVAQAEDWNHYIIAAMLGVRIWEGGSPTQRLAYPRNLDEWFSDVLLEGVLYDVVIRRIHGQEPPAGPVDGYPLYKRPSPITDANPIRKADSGDYLQALLLGIRPSPKTGQEAKWFTRTPYEWLQEGVVQRFLYPWFIEHVHKQTVPSTLIVRPADITRVPDTHAGLAEYLQATLLGVKTFTINSNDYTYPRTLFEWFEAAAIAVTKPIYEWSISTIYGKTLADVTPLYPRTTKDGTVADEANAGEYLQGAFYGIRSAVVSVDADDNPSTPNVNETRYYPREYDEWIVDEIFKRLYPISVTYLHRQTSPARTTADVYPRPASVDLETPTNPTTAPTALGGMGDYLRAIILGTQHYSITANSITTNYFYPRNFKEWADATTAGAYSLFNEYIVEPVRALWGNLSDFIMRTFHGTPAIGTAINEAARNAWAAVTTEASAAAALLSGVMGVSLKVLTDTSVARLQGALHWIVRGLDQWFNTPSGAGGQQDPTPPAAIGSVADVITALNRIITGGLWANFAGFVTWFTTQLGTGGNIIRTTIAALTTNADLMALSTPLAWIAAPVTSPGPSNVRSIGFNSDGNFEIQLPETNDFMYLQGGGPGSGEILLTLGKAYVGGNTATHSRIKFDDGVKLNASLKFEPGNTNPGNEDRGIGYSSEGDVFIKAPEGSNSMHYQAGGHTSFTAQPHGIRLPTDVGQGDDVYPTQNGEMRHINGNMFVFSGGSLRSLSSLPAFISPDTDQLQLPVLTRGSATPTAAQLDAAFGSYKGAIGVTRSSSNSLARHQLCVKTDTEWLLYDADRTVTSALGGTTPPTAHRRIRYITGTTTYPRYPSPGLGRDVMASYNGRFMLGERGPRPANPGANPPVTADRGYYYIVTSTADDTVTSASSGTPGTIIQQEIPYMEFTVTAAFNTLGFPVSDGSLRSAFGSQDGTIGYVRIVWAAPSITRHVVVRLGTNWWVFNLSLRQYEP